MNTMLMTPTAVSFHSTAFDTSSGPGARIRAAVKAIEATHLESEGFSAEAACSVEFLLEDTNAVLCAVDQLGALDEGDEENFGFYLAELLLENDLNDMVSRAHSEYLVDKQFEDTLADAADAYELNDPKHPGYLERIGL